MRGLELHRPPAVVVDPEHDSPNHAIFTAQPFERGWGVTVGNALRRVLLSSIEGSAITAVRFSGVDHEYDSIPGVMEDVTDLILNLKRVPLRLHGLESITATVNASKPGELTAAAIDGGSELEVIDPSIHLATLAEEGTVLVDLMIRRGRGYVPADEHAASDLGAGFIYLDAAFSPVRKANFRIEPARVGHATDYEKLVLEVWTNGAVTAAAAVAEAACLLADHLPIFMGLEKGAEAAAAAETPGALDENVETLELGGRILNMLRNAGVRTVKDLVSLSETEIKGVPGLGKKALEDIRLQLESQGLSLGMRFDLPRS
jgi:DNA-directed RNA polymerase subunit alpha